MRYATEDEHFAGLVHESVLVQFPDAIITEPHAHFFVWRRGSKIVHMQRSEAQVTLRFVCDGVDSPSEQTFSYGQTAVQPIANAIVEWLDFRRYRQR